MARSYVSQPTLSFEFVKPQRIRFDVVGSAMNGGRNLAGQSISIDTSGGGIVTASYEQCFAQAAEEHEYLNWLGARLNGSIRFINVPIRTEWWGPFPTINGRPRPMITGITHSDGTYFSDGAGYSQATVWGTVVSMINTGVLRIRVFGMSRPLRWSDWFSIYHATMGWRAYRYWDVIERHDDGSSDGYDYQEYTLALAPPLREAVSAGDHIEFGEPKFVASLQSGTTIPWEVESFWVSRPTLQFTEAF